jgi:hypothetical protein
MTNKIEYPRSPRRPLEGEVLIKRPGKPTLKTREGNISDGGLYLNLQDHDLQKGRRVDVIVVRESGSVRDMQRMTGIVIRIDTNGVALVTYKSGELKRQLSGEGSEAVASSASHLETS